MTIYKKCAMCSKVHTEIPKDARPWNEQGIIIGYVWECECKSTLFKAVKETMQESIKKERRLGK